ncbi:MAG: Uma2 family endonuclease [Deinococcales bacterium]
MLNLPAQRLISSQEYQQMIASGVFHEDEAIELIEGMLIQMSPVGIRHSSMLNNLNILLLRQLLGKAIVSIQNPLSLDDGSEPEPDLMVLKLKDDCYASGHPRPEDVLLLIEVADSSLEYDSFIKARLYARAQVEHYWLIDVNQKSLKIHKQPSAQGYGNVVTLNQGRVELWDGMALELEEMFRIFAS